MSDVLYVPIRRRDSSGQVRLEMRTLSDDRLALPAYTSLKELVRCCGPQQPWMGVDRRGLQEIHRTTRYDVVLLDGRQPPPPPVEDDDRPFENPLGRRATR
ncbi:SAV_915 family protein [Rhodococcus rhodochrous]|uniref:SAV_915 family protein n=1 Tax=Rhodococcus rhodochrous TaxID=1829 RepID=UPI0023F7A150